MYSSNPTILLVHGCFATPACFDKLVPHLKKAGYPTLTATYPSSNPEDPSEVTAQKDSEYLRNQYLVPLVENEHRDVILAVHSFGGVVAAGAAVGLSKTDRKAANLKGGVLGLVYIAANILQEGQSLYESFGGGDWPPWFLKDNV